MEIRLLGRDELRYHKCPFTYGQFKVKIYIAVFMTTALQGYLGGMKVEVRRAGISCRELG